MNRRKRTVTVATAGVAAGVVGLALLANPLGAGAAPTLPSVAAEDLVQSVLSAQPPALGGTVQVVNNLGLPSIPGLPQANSGTSAIRVWADGQGRSRASLANGEGEQTFVLDGENAWTYDSAKRTATKSTVDKKAREEHQKEGKVQPTDPASAAKELVSAVRSSSDLSVDGTAEVAGRSAYELVLTPKSSERTLLREVRVAVDAEKRVPLRLVVLANGSTDPVLQVGFNQLTVGEQDAALFRFTPPPGVTVEEKQHKDKDNRGPNADKGKVKDAIQAIGDGWDTVVAGKLPPAANDQSTSDRTPRDPLALARQIGKSVNGSWGSGWLIETKVGSALVTSDGRFAAGAVPQQVLTEAIGQVK